MGVLANPDSNQAMVPSKQKRTHAVFCVSSAHRLAPTSKPRFVGERVKLGDVLQVVNGKNQKAVKDENGQYPIYGSGGQMGWASSYICPADTVIIGRKGNINKPIYVSEPFWNVDTAFGLVAKPELLDARYLYHFCKHYDFGKLNTTCTIPSLTRKNIEGILLRLPSLGGQKETAAQLDSILKQIALAQQEIAGLDSLVKSRFVEMFESKDYGMRPMGDLVESITAGTNVGGQQRPLGEGEYGVLKISAVTQGVFNPGELKAVNDVSHIKMIHPRKGDLLFSRANTSEMVGATAIVDKDYGDLFLPDKLWRLDPTDEVETVFLKALLSSPSIRAEMSKVSTGSSGSMQNISMAKFRKLPAFLPPLALQQEFAAFASQVDKSRFIAQQQIEKLQMLYDSLAQDYFGD